MSLPITKQILHHWQNNVMDLPLSLTDIKAQKIGLGILSLTSFVSGAIVASGIIPLSFLIAIPLYAAGGALLWYAYSLTDYEDPKALRSICEEAKKLPLKDLVAKHSWENLFQFQLLNPEDFSRSFIAYANYASFKDLCQMYIEVKKYISSRQPQSTYTLPSLNKWEEKFKEETKHLSLTTIVKEYPIEELKNLFTQEKFVQLEKIYQAKNALEISEQFLKQFASLGPIKQKSLGPYKEFLQTQYEQFRTEAINQKRLLQEADMIYNASTS